MWEKVRLAWMRCEAKFENDCIFCSMWHYKAIFDQIGEISPSKNAGHPIRVFSLKACKVRRLMFVLWKIGGYGALSSMMSTIFWMNRN